MQRLEPMQAGPGMLIRNKTIAQSFQKPLIKEYDLHHIIVRMRVGFEEPSLTDDVWKIWDTITDPLMKGSDYETTDLYVDYAGSSLAQKRAWANGG